MIDLFHETGRRIWVLLSDVDKILHFIEISQIVTSLNLKCDFRILM